MTLQALTDRLELRITDDGCGFDRIRPGSGLANMQRRAQLCGGTLSITSPVGGGTDVLLTLPLTVPDIGAQVAPLPAGV
jgi:signal transduction histidine kinase